MASQNLDNELKITLLNAETISAGASSETFLFFDDTTETPMEKNTLTQRDEIVIALKPSGNNMPTGAVITLNYYSLLLGLIYTETTTLSAITADAYHYQSYWNEYTKQADYFTLSIEFQQNLAYTVTAECILKKKIAESSELLSGGLENGMIYMDGNRTDSYTEDGSILTPFKTPDSLIAALNVHYAALSDKQQSNYTVMVANGTYDWTSAIIPTYKSLKFIGNGVVFSGNGTITQTPIGGSGEQPYTRIEFIGMEGFRAEKGQNFQISGNWTFARSNDSLTYITFKGCRVSGNWVFDTDGTFVVQCINNRFSGTISTGTFTDPDSAVLIESSNQSRFSGTISGKVSLYTCDLTEFSGNINITPIFDCRITNCKFSNTSNSIIASKNLYIDDKSLKSLTATTETVAGMTIQPLDTFVGTPVNAVAADIDITVGAVLPDVYVANVYAYEDFEVKALPLVNIQAARTYTVAGEPAVNVFSTLETALAGDNNDLLFTSKTLGVAGDAIEIAYVDPGAEGALSIAVVGTVITITLANSAVPAITTIASEIKSLIEATPAADALVGVTYPAANDGTGIVTALAQTPLAGGTDATTLVIGTDTYTFVDALPGAIAALSPLADVEIVDNLDDTFTVTALYSSLPGASGTGYTVTPDGVFITGTADLAGGQDADTIVFDVGGADEATYTFIANGEIPGTNEIEIGATADAAGYNYTCANIVATGDGASRYTIHASTPADALFKIRSTILGTAGDGDVTTTVDGTRIDPVGTGVVANGVDEVLMKTTLNSIEYIYWDADSPGNDPTLEYPSSIPVGVKATEQLTAAELATAIATDTDMASATANGAVVTAVWGVKGVVGNAITFTDGTGNLVTAAATMAGGINGTPGYKGQTYYDGTYLWLCKVDDYTTTQYQWEKVTAEWGNIIGTIDNQADLVDRLNNKYESIVYGENLTAGQVAYFKPADGKLWKANGAASGTIIGDLFYILTTGNADDGAKTVLKEGIIEGTGFTVGYGYVSKDTAGTITQTAFSTAGTFLREVIYYRTTTIAYFRPSDVIAGF
jgi:hypothetical protein